jgi:hypothetical protein
MKLLLLLFFFVLLPIINLVLAITATRCARRGQQGLELFLSLVFIWMVPIIGPSVALYSGRRAQPTS